MINKIKKTASDFSELVMFKHSIFALPFIFIAMITSANGWFGFKLFLLGVFAAVTARNFAMGVNRYLDRDIDAINPRTSKRPSVDGRIGGVSMVAFIIANALTFIGVAFLTNPLAFKLSVPILIVIGSYTLFKRFSPLAHIVLGISLGLAPIAGVVAVQGSVTLWSIYLAIGVMFWVAGFDLLYSLQDIEFDKAQGLHSIPSRFGAKNTLLISKTFHILTIIFWILFIYESLSLGYIAYIGVFISAVLLAYEHYLVSKDFEKIDKAFFTVNGYLGFIFLTFVIFDILV
ncbi:MAG: 4-hydroxybenzoate polyprenyltransferase [Sulfurovaceae bacterium]|nr:4-hydroxybenzoate polyprenyltransferase [Sulfurovaceae bacterium]MDD5549579.1 4-hydroxybenzoate polyprenyltransferase [Sulfurovaceae bacterium]